MSKAALKEYARWKKSTPFKNTVKEIEESSSEQMTAKEIAIAEFGDKMREYDYNTCPQERIKNLMECMQRIKVDGKLQLEDQKKICKDESKFFGLVGQWLRRTKLPFRDTVPLRDSLQAMRQKIAERWYEGHRMSDRLFKKILNRINVFGKKYINYSDLCGGRHQWVERD